MHRKSVVSHEWKILLLAIILGNYNQAAFSDSCRKANKSVSILKGQNLSVKFCLKHQLLENQYLTWRKKDSSWEINNCTNYDDNNLRCSGTHNKRYNLTGGTRNETIAYLVIEQAEESDMGVHIIQLYSGTRPTYTPLSLNLIVLHGKSPCTLMVQSKSREVKMSCNWVQGTKGELTEVFFRSKLINKQKLTSEMQCDKHNFNFSENCEVKLDIQDIMDKTILSRECVVNSRNETVEKTCQFPSVQKKTIPSDPTSLVEFACCTSKVETSLHWWYVYYGGYELLSLPEKSPLRYAGDNSTGFLCGVPKADGTLMVHGIGTLNFRKKTNYSISTLEVVNTTADPTCNKLVVNVSILASASTSTLDSPPTSLTKTAQCSSTAINCSSCNSSTLTQSSEGGNTHDKVSFISLAIISTIAFVISVFSCFTKCGFFKGGRSRGENILNSRVVRHDGDTELVQTMNFRPSPNLVQRSSENTWVRRNSTTNDSSADRVEFDNHGPEHLPSSSSGQNRALELHSHDSRPVMIEQHTMNDAQVQLGYTFGDTEKCDELLRGIRNASFMETACESMDDVEDTYMVHPPPTQTSSACFHSSLEELGICHEGKRMNSADVMQMPSCLVKPNIQGEDTEEGSFPRSLNIDALYAKPDLSRKREKSSSQSSVSRPVKPMTRGDDKRANSVMEGTDIETLYAKPDMNRKKKKSVFRSVSPQSGREEMVPSQDLSYDDVRNPADCVAGSGTAKTTRKSEHIYENCK